MALNAINLVPGPKPWKLTFSYGRALQQSCLKAWAGKPENVPALQEQLMIRAKANHDAALGKLEGVTSAAAGANDSLYQKNYVY